MVSPQVKSRVMVVDDDPIAVEVARFHVERRGMTVACVARDGAEATEQMARCGAVLDLLLVDLNMPDFDGIEFLRQLSTQRPMAKVIIVSGAIESVRRSAELLCAPYGIDLLGRIDKPLTAAKLDACLGQLHSSQSAMTASD